MTVLFIVLAIGVIAIVVSIAKDYQEMDEYISVVESDKKRMKADLEDMTHFMEDQFAMKKDAMDAYRDMAHEALMRQSLSEAEQETEWDLFKQ